MRRNRCRLLILVNTFFVTVTVLLKYRIKKIISTYRVETKICLLAFSWRKLHDLEKVFWISNIFIFAKIDIFAQTKKAC